jgi:hypothetical protein
LAVRAEHFLATSGVTADALFVVEATAMQINPAHPSANFVLANTVYLPARAGYHFAALSLTAYDRSEG